MATGPYTMHVGAVVGRGGSAGRARVYEPGVVPVAKPVRGAPGAAGPGIQFVPAPIHTVPSLQGPSFYLPARPPARRQTLITKVSSLQYNAAG